MYRQKYLLLAKYQKITYSLSKTVNSTNNRAAVMAFLGGQKFFLKGE